MIIIKQRFTQDGGKEKAEEPANLFEWDKANVNILFGTVQEEPATGTVEVRGYPLPGVPEPWLAGKR